MLPFARVGGRALPLDEAPVAMCGRSGGILIQWGMRAIPLGIAATLSGFAIGLAVTHEDPAEPGPAAPTASVFGTIHPDIFRFRAPAGTGVARAGLQLASLDPQFAPQIASDAPAEEYGGAMQASALPCGRAWLDENSANLNDRVAFFDKPMEAADNCPASFSDRFASAVPVRAGGPQRPTTYVPATYVTASVELQSAPDLKLETRRADAPKTPVSVVRRKEAPSLDDDGRMAIYDITARVVYLPSGKRLEAHSGLGWMMDNPRYANMKMRGVTPPNIYNLTLREHMFHGVRAIRLNPIDESRMYGRGGILAHTYMLGSNGQSNGCVAFANYPEFLNAYLKGEITRLAVVERLETTPGRLAAGQLPQSVKDLLKETRSRQYASAADR
jgi:Tlde1 domain